MIYYLQR
jgi:hypothetical protein